MEKEEVKSEKKESKWKKRLLWTAGVTTGLGLCALAIAAGYRHHDKKAYFHGVTLTFENANARYEFEEVLSEIDKNPKSFITHTEEMEKKARYLWSEVERKMGEENERMFTEIQERLRRDKAEAEEAMKSQNEIDAKARKDFDEMASLVVYAENTPNTFVH
jgi:hypothetical protein